MKNPWAYVIAFVLISGMLFFNNFKIPTFFPGETANTRGIITEAPLTPANLRANKQIVSYQYLVGDSVYSDRGNLRGEQEIKLVGSKMNITYSVEDPKKHEIVDFFEDVYPVSLNYSWGDSLSTEELKFENDIVFVEKRTIDNQPISSEILEFVVMDDYIIIVPLFNAERKEQKVLRRFDILVDEYDTETLVERGTEKVYH